jgi:hypothetical protein
LSYKTSLLACNHFQIWGGVDHSILWLSFAQQKAWNRWLTKDCFSAFPNFLSSKNVSRAKELMSLQKWRTSWQIGSIESVSQIAWQP